MKREAGCIPRKALSYLRRSSDLRSHLGKVIEKTNRSLDCLRSDHDIAATSFCRSSEKGQFPQFSV